MVIGMAVAPARSFLLIHLLIQAHINSMAFRFVHTADIHLDSPLRSLSLRDPDIAALIGGATRQSFTGIIDLCLDEAVDALMVAGDLYDRELTSMKTAAFLRAEMKRLADAGIRVFIIKGNHDSGSAITRHLSLPDNVHVFTGRAEAVLIEERNVAVHGISFASQHIAESLVPKFRPPVADTTNIGLLHTSLAGSTAHDVYAPCGLSDLTGVGFDYWGLGHIHQREVHAQGPTTVVMPGMPQGRHVNEAGPKTVTLVEIADDGSVAIFERHTSIAQFERVSVDVSDVGDWQSALSRIEAALGKASDAALSEHLVARLEVSGTTDLAFHLRRDLDRLLLETRDYLAETGKTFVETIDLQVRAAVIETASSEHDPFAELRHLMAPNGTGNLDGVKKAARELVEHMQQQLPSDLRDEFGNSDAHLDALVESFMEEGAETLLARFEADRTIV